MEHGPDECHKSGSTLYSPSPTCHICISCKLNKMLLSMTEEMEGQDDYSSLLTILSFLDRTTQWHEDYSCSANRFRLMHSSNRRMRTCRMQKLMAVWKSNGTQSRTGELELRRPFPSPPSGTPTSANRVGGTPPEKE
jgi:hypothetical protein